MPSQSQWKRQTSQSASTTVCIDTPVSERWLPVLNWLCISVWVSGFLASSLPPVLHADAKQLPDATKQSLVYSHVYRHIRFRALVLSSQLIVHYALSLSLSCLSLLLHADAKQLTEICTQNSFVHQLSK